MLDRSVLRPSSPCFRGLRLVYKRRREDVGASRPQDPGDLQQSGINVKDVLENILRYYQIKSLVLVGQGFRVLVDPSVGASFAKCKGWFELRSYVTGSLLELDRCPPVSWSHFKNVKATPTRIELSD